MSSPKLTSNRLRGAIRGGLWSSSSVPGAGILMRVEPYWEAGHDVKRRGQSGRHSIACEAGLRLLIGGQAAEIHERNATNAEGGSAADAIRDLCH